MKRILSLTLSLVLVLAFSSSVLARSPESLGDRLHVKLLEPVEPAGFESVREDTMFLFATSGDGAWGMPGTNDRGYDFNGEGVCEPAGWIEVDETLQLGEYWHLASTTISTGTGTDFWEAGQPWTPGDANNDYAIWCGRLDVCGWAHDTGYGGNWEQYAVLDTGVWTDSVEVDFAYISDFEGDTYDYFEVLLEVDDGTEMIFQNQTGAEQTYTEYSIKALQSDYPEATDFGDVIFRFVSDGGWSDEDGAYISDIGAVWLDNMQLTVDGTVTFQDDFESGLVPGGLTFTVPPAAGMYADLYTNLYSEDMCMVNNSCAWAFFDLNTENPEYPVPVVVYGGEDGPWIDDMIQSPMLELMHEVGNPTGVPVTLDAESQVWFWYWAYMDNPLNALIFQHWDVAAKVEGNDCLNYWADDNFVYYGPDKVWIPTGRNCTLELTNSAMGGTVTGLAVKVGALDACGFWCDINGDGTGHTPAPYIDNCEIGIINASAVAWDTNAVYTFQDNFPEEEVPRKVRIDSAADIAPTGHTAVIIGDSSMVELNMDLAGGILETFNTDAGENRPEFYLWWQVVAGPHVGSTSAGMGDPDATDGIYSPKTANQIFDTETWNTMQADSSAYQGTIQDNKFSFDFADNFFEAGDVIRWFYRAESNTGVIETRPGWAMSSDPDLRSYYMIRCLPTSGASLLFVEDGRYVRTYWEEAFRYNGYAGYDQYDVQAPTSGLGNGIAGRLKVQADLNGYQTVVWDSGDIPSFTITQGQDNTDDAAVLEEFLVNNPTDSYLWALGSELPADLGLASDFLFNVLGAQLESEDLFFDDYTGILVPKVFATHTELQYLGSDPYCWVDGGCPSIENFSVIIPNPTIPLSSESHDWEDDGGANLVAGVFNEDPDGDGEDTSPTGQINRALTNPFSYYQVWDAGYGLPAGTDYARLMVGHVLNNLFSHSPNTVPDGVPEVPHINALHENFPNPFNPKTTIRFSTAQTGNVNLAVYDISGRLVKELVNGSMSAGDHEIVWSGKNGNGNQVASGVYFYKMVTADFSSTEKMVLLK